MQTEQNIPHEFLKEKLFLLENLAQKELTISNLAAEITKLTWGRLTFRFASDINKNKQLKCVRC